MARRTGLKDHCRGLAGTTEDVKWSDDLVFSVRLKMYAAFDLDDDNELSFKCDEDDFDRLTEIEGIVPAPYAAKLGWVKVYANAKIGVPELRKLLTKSHGLVAAKLSKKAQRELGLL